MTAVEWLEEELKTRYGLTPTSILLFRDAKELEKQQIIDAHGNKTKKSGGISNSTYTLTGVEYYKETFKNKETMTPKEKAIELVDKFKLSTGANTKINIYVAKQCALIAVDEILKVSLSYAGKDYDFYLEVKQEIENL